MGGSYSSLLVLFTTEMEKKVLSLENDIKSYKEREIATAAEGTVYAHIVNII